MPAFAAALAPVALVGLVLTVGLVALLHRAEFTDGATLHAGADADVRVNRVLMSARAGRDRRADRAVLRRPAAGQGGDHHRRRCCC